MTNNKPYIRSFLKWPGGKFCQLDEILAAAGPGKYADSRFFDVFGGSGVVGLNWANRHDKTSVYADSLLDVVDTMQVVTGTAGGSLPRVLSVMAESVLWENTKEAYLQRRAEFNARKVGKKNMSKTQRATWFIYLNRHGFNGLVRYNLKGEFNVPPGAYAKDPTVPVDAMRAFRDCAMRCAMKFMHADFTTTMSLPKAGDVVYCDPPFWPLSGTAKFTTYDGKTFGEAEHTELAETALAAAKRGARVLIHNHDLPAVRDLYERLGVSEIVELPNVRRNISATTEGRGTVNEIIAIWE